MMIALIGKLAIGVVILAALVVGVLIARKNPNKVNKAVTDAKGIATTVKKL